MNTIKFIAIVLMDSANILNQPLKKSHIQQIQTSFIGTSYLATVLTVVELILFYRNVHSLNKDFKTKIVNIREKLLESQKNETNKFLKQTLDLDKNVLFQHDKAISQNAYDTIAVIILLIFIVFCIILTFLWRENVAWKHVAAFVIGSSLVIIPFQIYFTENVIKKTETMSEEEIIQYVHSICKHDPE